MESIHQPVERKDFQERICAPPRNRRCARDFLIWGRKAKSEESGDESRELLTSFQTSSSTAKEHHFTKNGRSLHCSNAAVHLLHLLLHLEGRHRSSYLTEGAMDAGAAEATLLLSSRQPSVVERREAPDEGTLATLKNPRRNSYCFVVKDRSAPRTNVFISKDDFQFVFWYKTLHFNLHFLNTNHAYCTVHIQRQRWADRRRKTGELETNK